MMLDSFVNHKTLRSSGVIPGGNTFCNLMYGEWRHYPELSCNVIEIGTLGLEASTQQQPLR
jgi:hypothetical protein